MTTMNTNRKRNDAMASVAVDDATEFDAGALLFLDTDDAKPASSQADQSTEAANQRLFAKKFLGAAAGGKLATETWKDKVLVDFDPTAEREYSCASETHEVGDLLGVDENGDGDALEDAKLVKVTDPSLAIAVCVRKDASASTTVRCRFIRSVLMPGVSDVRDFSPHGTKEGAFVGAAAAGAITLTGAAVGDRVLSVFKFGDASDNLTSGTGVVTAQPNALFESVITVADQIQQVSATDLSDNKYIVRLAPAHGA
jgi:hypothetical protein